MPSLDFAELYRNVVAEEIDELGTHPRATPNPEDADAPPDPHFGDIFIDENDKNALMVITAECDLMYAPEADAKREHRPEQSVVMIPANYRNSRLPGSAPMPPLILCPIATKRTRLSGD